MFFVCCIGMLLAAFASAATSLEQGFNAPPLEARPRVYWYWMNGNLSKDGITRDLEAMKRIGLGGAMMMEVTVGIPEGNVRTGTPEWWELIRHMLSEADRLGLRISFGNGTGWSGSQGPWVKPEDAMQQVVSSEVPLKGPRRWQGQLPQPHTAAGHYRDIAVFAVPAVAGDLEQAKPKITVTPAAEKVRIADLHDSTNGKLPPLADDLDVLGDGDPDTCLRLPPVKADQTITFTLEYAQPFTARSLNVFPGFWQSYTGELQVSDDGLSYRKVRDIDIPSQGPVTRAVRTLSFAPLTARWFRLVISSAKSPLHGRTEIGELTLGGGTRLENWEAATGLVTGYGDTAMPPLEPADIVDPARMVGLSGKVDAQGQLTWDVPQGDWVIVRLGHTTFSIPYDTPPKWAQGLEIDKLAREPLERHWKAYMGRIVELAGPLAGKALAATHTDSWEAGSQNWTPLFREEFQKRRGYDMTPFLPALTGRVVDSVEKTRRFFWDMRRTIADLIADNYFGGLADLAHRSGIKFSTEAYGNTVMDAYQCAGRSDMPMTEIWTNHKDRKPEENWYLKWGSSPAHVYGRKIVGAESFTTSPNKQLGNGRFLDTPYSIKTVGDNHLFCGGVNQLSIHVYAHQPWADLAPGMTVGGYGLDFNRNQTWWDMAGPWVDYLSRSSFLLQQGLFVGDVLYFYGERPKGNGPAARVSLRPALPRGYDYDMCPAEVILTRLAVKDKRLVLPDGMSYGYLVVNHGEPMTLPVVEKLRELVAAGATLVGPRPQPKSPGLGGPPDADERIRNIVSELWADVDGSRVKARDYGQGRILWDAGFQPIFERDGLAPDFSYTAADKTELNYIHRRAGDTDIYFVANARQQPVEAELAFRVSGKRPQFWHPDSGRIEPAGQFKEADGQTRLNYRFDPSGSVFVIFAPVDQAAAPPASGKNWKEFQPVLPVRGPWQVQFDPRWSGPKEPVTFSELSDWKDHGDPGVKYYSGRAVYRTGFDWQAGAGSPGRCMLDLGEVAVMARVKLNGQDCGIAWKPPYRVDVSGALKAGRNELEVTVVNQWANRLIGDGQLGDGWDAGRPKSWPKWLESGEARTGGQVTFTTGRHWQKDDELQPSGLLGPVTLQRAE
jgi:hypothetical protein